MLWCFNKQPNQRPTIDQILAHEFLAGADNHQAKWVEDFEAYKKKKEANVVPSFDDLFN